MKTERTTMERLIERGVQGNDGGSESERERKYK